jgi:hypothetical protein
MNIRGQLMIKNINHSFVWLITIFWLLASAPLVHANLADEVVGSYSGTILNNETSCTPGPDGSQTALLTLPRFKELLQTLVSILVVPCMEFWVFPVCRVSLIIN